MKKFTLIFLFAGFVFLFLSIDITFAEEVIGTNIKIKNQLFFIFSLIFFVASLILFTMNKSLESMVIPTGTLEEDQKRIRTAMENYPNTKKSKPYVLISGKIKRDNKGIPKKDSEQYLIYKKLRKNYELKSSDFIIEGKSRDTLENFLYSIKKLKRKRINHMKIATNPTQYWRFKLFESKAKKEGLIDDSFKVEPLYTSESLKEFVYGVLAYAKDYLRIKSFGSLEKAKEQKTGNFGNFLKNILNKS